MDLAQSNSTAGAAHHFHDDAAVTEPVLSEPDGSSPANPAAYKAYTAGEEATALGPHPHAASTAAQPSGAPQGASPSAQQAHGAGKAPPDTYDAAELRPAPAPQQIDSSALRLASVNHLIASKRNNLLYLDSDTVLTSAGNTAILYQPSSGTMTFLPGIDGGGVAAIALHPCEPLFLVAEQCKTRAPNAYVYRYLGQQRVELHRVLRGRHRARVLVRSVQQ